jgi:hypothetical protein
MSRFFHSRQACLARGLHGLPRVSPGPALRNPSTPCRRATPETAFRPFRGWPAHRAGGLRPSDTPLDTPRRTSLIRRSRDESTEDYRQSDYQLKTTDVVKKEAPRGSPRPLTIARGPTRSPAAPHGPLCLVASCGPLATCCGRS